jgi:FkbM family methyltransferase
METKVLADATRIFERLLFDFRGSREMVFPGPLLPEPNESSWIEYNLRHGVIHDAGFANFVNWLIDSAVDVLVDIGANYGYSVTTCEALGYRGRYLSFEPLAEHVPALHTLEGLLGSSRFRFLSSGVSDFTGDFEIATPVVQGQRLTALSFDVQVERSAENLARNLLASMPGLVEEGVEGLEISFHIQSCSVTTLDTIATADSWLAASDTRFALKIDAEGSEARIVQGALGFLEAHHPPLYIEGPSEETVETLLGLGYEERVFPSDQPWNRLFISDANPV